MTRAGIGLGSNLGNRYENLRNAVDAIVRLCPADEPVLKSRIYESAPVNCPQDAGPFLNAAIEIAFAGSPETLLTHLQQIETSLGRPSRRPKNQPRTIDLDLLYFGDITLSTPDLILPHPLIFERLFVLAPLADICPERILPGQSQTISLAFKQQQNLAQALNVITDLFL